MRSIMSRRKSLRLRSSRVLTFSGVSSVRTLVTSASMVLKPRARKTETR